MDVHYILKKYRMVSAEKADRPRAAACPAAVPMVINLFTTLELRSMTRIMKTHD
jgi:hypothetical protein